MMTKNEGATQLASSSSRIASLLLRSTVLFNLLLVGLAWSPWFEGNERDIGFADKLFGELRFGGFRADVVWLFFSSFLLLFPLLYFFERAKGSGAARLNVIFCVAGIAGFCFFLYRLRSLLWFG
jgi:hypothetical protein